MSSVDAEGTPDDASSSSGGCAESHPSQLSEGGPNPSCSAELVLDGVGQLQGAGAASLEQPRDKFPCSAQQVR